MLIYPAIDILGGKCVRLTEGEYGSEKVYNEDPVEQASLFEQQGAQWIHVVDLDGAKEGSPVNRSVIEAICKAVNVKVQVGGGVRDTKTAKALLENGVSRVVVGSALTKGGEAARGFFDEFGDKVAAGIDTREGKVAVSGWTKTSELDGVDFARSLEKVGCQCVIHTDISRDGRLQGPDLEGLQQMVNALGVEVIASGGVSCLDDLSALHQTGAQGVIVGKAIYEERFTLPQAIALAKSQVS